MIPVVVGQAQRVGQRGEHGGRRVGVATLLEPGEVLDADTGERRQLRPSQARRAPPRPGRQADLGGRDSLPPASQERTQLSVDHRRQSANRWRAQGGPVGVSLGPASHRTAPATACWPP